MARMRCCGGGSFTGDIGGNPQDKIKSVDVGRMRISDEPVTSNLICSGSN